MRKHRPFGASGRRCTPRWRHPLVRPEAGPTGVFVVRFGFQRAVSHPAVMPRHRVSPSAAPLTVRATTDSIAKQPLQLKRRHCERQRSNPSRHVKKAWIASSQTLLAMTPTHLRDPAAYLARGLFKSPTLFKKRARGMPGAQCTRSLACAQGSKYAREYSQRRHRNHPAFPTQWFYDLWRTLPGDEFVLPPSPAN
jgi:hypothetical protein